MVEIMKNNGKIMIIMPNLCGGGAEKLHVNLANYWVNLGYEVEFVLMQKKGDLLDLLSPQVLVTDLKVNRILGIILPLAGYLKSNEGIVLAVMWPVTTVSVISWLLSGFKQKIILSDHNFLSISTIRELNISRFTLKFTMGITYRLATHIIAVSKGVKADLQGLSGLPNRKISVIYNPVTQIPFPSGQVKQEAKNLWSREFDYHILAVGSLENQKGFDDLIIAFSKVCKKVNAQLIILGEGSKREFLSTLVLKLDLEGKVSMPGFVKNPNLWFETADLFVLSSKWEGFGNVIVEALECGVPIVSTDCDSGPREILQNGKYGTLVSVGDTDALSSSIYNSLFAHHDKNALIARSKDFSIDKISQQYLNLFNRVTDEKNKLKH
jgi:glycosyltransferase involved in cell wall biosynthesis